MHKLLPILFASPVVITASGAPPFVNNVHRITVMPEPATNVLLVCGLLTVTGLAIFLGKKIG
jgi:hypothetical protein